MITPMRKSFFVCFLLCLLVVRMVNSSATSEHSGSYCEATNSTVMWSYNISAPDGPQHWSKLCSSWSVCDSPHQSPIDFINAHIISEDDLLDLDYFKIVNATFFNNGHTVELAVPEAAKDELHTRWSGSAYSLEQFHFHTPSEHTVNGTSYPLEAHFVHVNSSGHWAVLGFLIEVGPPATNFIAELAAYASQVIEQSHSIIVPSVDITHVLSGSQSYWHYSGSLTTPPCTENVNWFVRVKPFTASLEQIDALVEALGRDSRPTQKLNNRPITAYHLDIITQKARVRQTLSISGYIFVAGGLVLIVAFVVLSFVKKTPRIPETETLLPSSRSGIVWYH